MRSPTRACLHALIAAAIVVSFSCRQVLAASMGTFSVSISSAEAGHASTDYTFSFTPTTTSTPVEYIRVLFTDTAGGSTMPAHMVLTSATLGTHTTTSMAWTLDNTSGASGFVTIDLGTQEYLSGTVSFVLSGITNPANGDCQVDPSLEDLCYVTASTLTNSSSVIDLGYGSFYVHTDPYFEYLVDDIPSGETHNGVTSTVNSTSTSIAFGRIQVGVRKCAIQKITIRTNAPHGYSVTTRLDAAISGNYSGSVIDPFGATNATWATPQDWDHPDGTTPGTNTGWIGANTSDSGVSGWGGGTSGKFGPMSTVAHEVVHSTTASPTAIDTYVSYCLEVNGIQPADVYSGTIIYTANAEY